MNKDSIGKNNLALNVSSLTANIEALIDEEKSSRKKVFEKENTRVSSSKKYNEDDLKNHTKIMIELEQSIDKSIKYLIEYDELKSGFLDEQEGLSVIFLFFLLTICAPIILSGDIMKIVFVGATLSLIISIIHKVLSYKKRIRKKEQALKGFNENKTKVAFLLNRKNSVQTYIALSYNSKYRRTFNPNLYKMLRDELEKKNSQNQINYRVWQEFSFEIKRGLAQV